MSNLDLPLDDAAALSTAADTQSEKTPPADEATTPAPEVVEAVPPPVAEITPTAVTDALAPPPPQPDGPWFIQAGRILEERPDVLNAYFAEHIRHDGAQREGWVKMIGGSDSAEGYAKYWYERNGRFEGYSQGRITAAENIDAGRILTDRPDVMHAYQRDYLDHHGWKSHHWRETLGGSGAEDYAKYWFRNHGKAEGYNQRPIEAAEAVAEAPDEQPPAPGPLAETLMAVNPVGDEAVAIVGAAPDEPMFG